VSEVVVHLSLIPKEHPNPVHLLKHTCKQPRQTYNMRNRQDIQKHAKGQSKGRHAKIAKTEYILRGIPPSFMNSTPNPSTPNAHDESMHKRGLKKNT
jgi:hypothetical protein